MKSTVIIILAGTMLCTWLNSNPLFEIMFPLTVLLSGLAAIPFWAVWWPVDFGMWLRKIHQGFHGNLTKD